MCILTGNLIVRSHDVKTDEVVQESIVGPYDLIFVPSMEPHSMRNQSDNEEATFFCCIANVYGDELK